MALTTDEMNEMRMLQTKMDEGSITDTERDRLMDMRRRMDMDSGK